MVHEAQAITWCVRVICVQRLANAQEKQQDPSNPVERREEMGMEVQAYESHIQTSQQNIERIEADLRVERSALQGESCPKGNRS